MKIIDANLPHPNGFSRRGSTTELILHHAEAKRASVQDINRWHNDRGWNGIGYHYYIRKDGSVYRGRPEWAIGAHAEPHNSQSIGICCEGSYMTETMPAAQLGALKALIRDVQSRYGGKLRLLRHKDVNSTDCPGTRFPWAEAQKYMEEEPELTEKQVRAIAREETKTYLASLEKLPVSDWAKEDLAKAKANGITDGTAPQAYATREQVAVMIQRTK